MIRISIIIVALGFCAGCSPASKLKLSKRLQHAEQELQDHTGFVLYDVQQKKTVFAYKADRYFTPASNTKILTLYAALKIIGDSVPALRYAHVGDSTIFWATGDPSFLYKFTHDNGRTFSFLKNAPGTLFWCTANDYTVPFGSGWAWDDYNSAYSAERSAFPVYGNIMTVERVGSVVNVKPNYFEMNLQVGERKKREDVSRDVESNNVYFHPGLTPAKKPVWNIPFRTSLDLTSKLLADTLEREVTLISSTTQRPSEVLYSIPADSLYRVLMQDSDNFIAEQLLLMCANIVRDSMKTEVAIRHVQENYLRDLPDRAIWVDGSGLSRYNLITARSIVRLWEKISEEVPRERLFPLLATGGKSGTIKSWYGGEVPYIFGKTGSLSNNHNLSGFLITKSGKTMIFAFMNNNFVKSTSEVRREMQKILEHIRDKY